MNRVKSIFIGFYPMLAMGITGYAGRQLYLTRDVLAWVGPLMTSVPFMMFLSYIMMLKTVARTSSRFPGVNAVAIVGAALSGYVAFVRGGTGALPFAFAASGAVGFALYSVWYSRLGRSPSKLAVGRPFPESSFKKIDGGTFSTRELEGRPALMFFYRGNWCPLCMAQVKEISARYREIAELGARVVLISPQPHKNTAALAKRFDVPFEFLTDEGNRVAKALDLEMKSGLPMGMGLLGYDADTVFPTVVVMDAKGVVRWLDQTDNYRVRPEPDTFLPLLRQLATGV